jgi:hypothetical protein
MDRSAEATMFNAKDSESVNLILDAEQFANSKLTLRDAQGHLEGLLKPVL